MALPRRTDRGAGADQGCAVVDGAGAHDGSGQGHPRVEGAGPGPGAAHLRSLSASRTEAERANERHRVSCTGGAFTRVTYGRKDYVAALRKRAGALRFKGEGHALRRWFETEHVTPP